MSKRLQIQFPTKPIIVTLGADHSTVVHKGNVINKRSIKALGCLLEDGDKAELQPGDTVSVFGFDFTHEFQATYVGRDFVNDHCAIVQDSDGNTESWNLERIRAVSKS